MDARLLDLPQTGLVESIAESRTYGYLVTVELPDGRKPQCRPWFPGSALRADVFEIAVGDEALVIPIGGTMETAIPVALIGVVNGGDGKPPSDWNNSRRLIYGSAVEVRETAGADVEGAVLRPFLDDLSTFLAGLDGVGDAAAASTAPTGAGSVSGAVSTLNAADVATMNVLRSQLIQIGALATTLKTLVDQAKAGQGTSPHVSGVLRAQVGS